MSESEWSFAAPAFDAAQALAQLRRSLRDLRLSERAGNFELRGKSVLQLQGSAAEGQPDTADAADTLATLNTPVLRFKLARQLRQSPDWDRFEVRSSADQRKLLDELKRRLARWDHDD